MINVALNRVKGKDFKTTVKRKIKLRNENEMKGKSEKEEKFERVIKKKVKFTL
jgi:hypothetical protein